LIGGLGINVVGATAPPAVAADADALARGAYLAAAAGCDQCHTDSDRGGQPYAGGKRLAAGAFGTLVTPNITPDRETGIGRWSAVDFTRAMRWGIAPDDSHYLPVFPFPYFDGLNDRDIADLKAFLDSLPAVSRPNLNPAEELALAPRAGASIAVAATDFAGPFRPDPTKDAVWNRGAYLVATIGRCGECHTPHTRLGVPDLAGFLAGTAEGPDGKKVHNITSDAETGIGKWSEEDITTFLKDGQTPDFDFVGGSMATIVKNTARLSDDDRRAIAVFLKSVPAKPFAARR
jgi:mono/diheme cytochrome c family protein